MKMKEIYGGKMVESEDSLLMELDRIQSFCGCRMEGVSMDFFSTGPCDCAAAQ